MTVNKSDNVRPTKQESEVSEEIVCHFGKHEGVRMGEIPTGYLRWAVEKIDPVPLPEHRKNENGTPKTSEAIKEMEEDMRNFLSAAEDELELRSVDGE